MITRRIVPLLELRPKLCTSGDSELCIRFHCATNINDEGLSWLVVFCVGQTRKIARFSPFNLNFSAVLSIFREGVRIEHDVAFLVVFVRPNPKINL